MGLIELWGQNLNTTNGIVAQLAGADQIHPWIGRTACSYTNTTRLTVRREEGKYFACLILVVHLRYIHLGGDRIIFSILFTRFPASLLIFVD